MSTERFNLSRRYLLQRSACGFGLAGLASIMSGAAADPLAPKAPHFPARARRVIFLFMHGGPSHVDQKRGGRGEERGGFGNDVAAAAAAVLLILRLGLSLRLGLRPRYSRASRVRAYPVAWRS